MPTLGIIISSARPNRVGEHVARWVADRAPEGWNVDMIDLAEKPLPFFDGGSPPKMGLERTDEHAIAWAERIAALDALVITAPEYNGSYPAILKNAIDYLYAELYGLPVSLVGYSWSAAAGSLAATETLVTRLGAAATGTTGLAFGADLDADGTMHVTEENEQALHASLEALVDAARAAGAERAS